MSDYYPDISHHHTVADWAKVEKNCPFMITKATQGTSFVDSAMAGIVKQCEKRGIPYWLYAYLNKGDELAQAKFLVKTCKDKIGKHFMGYVLDVEAGNAASGVQKAMDYLKTLEYKIMLYTMYAQYDKYKNIIAMRPGKCAWWEARYGQNNGKYDPDYPCHAGADLHQYTSNGSCPGFDEKVDLNLITDQGKKEKWFITPKKKPPKGITEYLHNLGLGAGEKNMSRIAAANCQAKEVRKALFALAEEEKLILPTDLNPWEETEQ